MDDWSLPERQAVLASLLGWLALRFDAQEVGWGLGLPEGLYISSKRLESQWEGFRDGIKAHTTMIDQKDHILGDLMGSANKDPGAPGTLPGIAKRTRYNA